MSLLRAEKITKKYRRNHVLRGVSLQVEPGELVGIVGENGSGKSTLLRILAGELTADGGRVEVSGSIGYCPQDPVVNDSLTVDEHLKYLKSAYKLKSTSYAEQLLKELGFDKFRKTRAGELSGGTRQKLNLTMALMAQPSILLLDEPYQGFDWETYLHFWKVAKELKDAGKAVIVISHLIFEQKKFDHIFNLKNGRVEREV